MFYVTRFSLFLPAYFCCDIATSWLPCGSGGLEESFKFLLLLYQVEGVVRQLTTAGDHERISAVINVLTNDFALSPQANHRKVSFFFDSIDVFIDHGLAVARNLRPSLCDSTI